ncbi:tryptophan synthase subunit alpha [Campylobacter sp. faydin G-24]|uniref:Tryptophan synthase alpha chain n=1 Tax=Campylobacter anatolicus TaxID=2829105 RepID=A0ABS5HH09_9BACT|nr:tryptophan synthase subunit alpha [Campylobacter anatolicus]MBR8463564.1 tryptophan synthase subunit alpha [Campylobacter anatolicus]
MDKIATAFKGKKANIGYIVAAHPSVEHTKEFLLNLDKSCIDLLELGLPYSDPLADGKLIAEASFNAVKNGVNTDTIFDMLSEVQGKFSKPIVFLVYFNLIFAYGIQKFIKRSAELDVSGFIIPDLPCEESDEIADLCSRYSIALVPLISVTSAYRSDKILKMGSGFIYAIGAIGVSGSKRADDERLKRLVSELKQKSDLPIAVGFGIKNTDDVKKVKSYADGAIIGTEIVRLTSNFSGSELMGEIEHLFKNAF